MALEAWTLDGVTLTSGQFLMLELTADPPKEKPEWVSSADSEWAALVDEPKHENREITMRLRVAPQASMNAALDQIGVIRDKLRAASSAQAGVPLVWAPNESTRSGTFDVLSGEILELPIGNDGQARQWFAARPIFTVRMTCKPYMRHSEVLVSTASSSTPVVTQELANIPGDARALARLIVTDTATQARSHVEWGLQGPGTYNAATSLLIDSDSLVTSGFAGTQTTRTGSYDPNASGNNAISFQLSAQGTAACGTGNQSHVGAFRVKVRVSTNSNSTRTQFRFVWQVGGGPPAANAWVNPPVGDPASGGGNLWTEIDLGFITIPAVVTGTQRWTGRVEGRYPSGGNITVWIDYLILVPVIDGYGKATASYVGIDSPTIAGFDDLDTGGSNLNAVVANAGGTWATSGATTDFSPSTYFLPELGAIRNITHRNTAVAEGGPRFGILGSTNYTSVDVGVEMAIINNIGNSLSGKSSQVIARWTNSSNYAFLRHDWDGWDTSIGVVVAGVTTILKSISGSAFLAAATLPFPAFRLVIYTNGLILGYIYGYSAGTGGVFRFLSGKSTVLATAGALATGLPGFSDQSLDTNGVDRGYTNFYVGTAPAEPTVIFSGSTAQIRYDTTTRPDTSGYYGPPPSYRGTRFLLPPGTSRIFAKARRNDVDVNDDNNVTDATQIQVAYQARSLVVPRV